MAGGERIALLRPADLLSIEVELVNLVVSEDATRLVKVDPDADAIVVIHLPPQSLAEASFTAQPPQPPIRTALAGPSRLAFRIPGDELPLTAQALLDWGSWEPLLAPTALPRGTAPSPEIPPPSPPGPMETAIEFPWRLIVSPDRNARWRTDTDATASAHTQLWSPVLSPTDEIAPGTAPPPADVRALHAPRGPEPFVTVPTDERRRQTVSLTSHFHLPVPGGEFTPVPLVARRLELSTLGANADLEGRWEYPLVPPEQQPPGFQAIGLRQYQHIAGLGRDTFARTVAIGWLCGTGHQAVVVSTVQRMPANLRTVATPPEGALFTGNGYLIRTYDVIVQQPIVPYSGLSAAFAHGGRELPLQSIELTTRTARIDADPGSDPAWLRSPDGTPVIFQAIATDIVGGTAHIALPLMFVPYEALGGHRKIRTTFDHPPAGFVNPRVIDLKGQSLTLAPPGAKPGSTAATVASVTYDIEQPRYRGGVQTGHTMKASGAPPWYLPRWLMRLERIDGASPAVADLLGRAASVGLTFDPTYLNVGFDPGQNRAEVFLGLVTPLPLALPSQRGGGLASPATTASALSRTVGPVAAPDKLQQGVADLSAFAQTKILGTIPLLSLLPVSMPFDAAAAAGPEPTPDQLDDPGFVVNPPRLTTRREPPGSPDPDLVETRFVWKPPLRSQSVFPLLTLDLSGADLLLESITRKVRGGPASALVRGRLRNIRLTFANALSAGIAELSFRAEAGKKLEFGASRVEIGFLGPLAFVNTLQSILPQDGFDDPPFVTADAQGVVAGYTLAVPSVGVGIFSIQNIAVSAALSIPWTDRPAGVRFALCERHKPFLVTVTLFGGGGFFAVGVSANGLESVEASVEFGGNISLNLGVASGGVYVMAGVYFGMTGKSVELTGYLRCGGYLSVLGIISISLEFYLAFTYRKKTPGGSEIWGQASLSVKVKIAFFSISVTLSIERRFAGADGDPTFADAVTPAEFADYLQAFA